MARPKGLTDAETDKLEMAAELAATAAGVSVDDPNLLTFHAGVRATLDRAVRNPAGEYAATSVETLAKALGAEAELNINLADSAPAYARQAIENRTAELTTRIEQSRLALADEGMADSSYAGLFSELALNAINADQRVLNSLTNFETKLQAFGSGAKNLSAQIQRVGDREVEKLRSVRRRALCAALAASIVLGIVVERIPNGKGWAVIAAGFAGWLIGRVGDRVFGILGGKKIRPSLLDAVCKLVVFEGHLRGISRDLQANLAVLAHTE